MRKLFAPGTIAFIALWLLLMVGGQSRFFRDPGTFWHTVVGRKIIHDVALFTVDPYSGSHQGQPWLPHQWLGEVTMAAVEKALGFDGLLLLAATILAFTFAPLFARLVQCGLHWLPAAFVLGLGVAAASGHFHVRPHLATIAATAALACVLLNVDCGRSSPKALFGLVPLFIVWSNCHGGALGGLATLWITTLGWLGFALLELPSPMQSAHNRLVIFLVVFLCTLTPLVNPVGWALPQCWLDIMGMPELKAIIQEHAPLDPLSPSSWPILAFAVVYIATLLATRQWPRVTWLLPLLWLALSCDRIRHAPLFAVFALAAFAEVFPATVWAKRLLASGSDLFQPKVSITASFWNWLIPIVLVATVVVIQSAKVNVPILGVGWAKLDPATWPVELQETLDQEPGGFTFNEYADGGYLIYFAPQFRPFVDDRCELFGGPWLKKYVEAEGSNTVEYLAQMQSQYGRFQYALTRTGSGYDMAIRGDTGHWALVKETNTATLYQAR